MHLARVPAPSTSTPDRPPLATGRPGFTDAAVAEVARSQGAIAGWRAALDRARAQGDGVEAAVRAAALAEGEFAVGLSDADGHGFAAVDRFAIRTLCWRVIEGRIHFAERADELAALPPRAPIDPQAVFDFLYFRVIPSPRTIFQGVHRLPAAHCLWFAGDQVDLRRYWTPRFEEPAGTDFHALAAEFRQRVRDAVAAQLDGSKPACFLSGGTDSSTVAGMIGEAAGRPAATYSIGFEAEGYDEMAYARLAAKRFGTEHHEHYLSPEELVRSIPEVAAHYDQPFGYSSVLPAFYCARMARQDGVTRLLGGDGGDELFGGNSRYAKQRIFDWYAGVPGALRGGLLEPVLQRTPVGALPLLRKGRSYIEQAKVPLPDRMEAYNLLHRLGIGEVFEAGFLARIDPEGPLAQQRQVWQQVAHASPLNRLLAFDWRYTLAEADLPKVVGATALAGVSTGFPFLDPRVVDFSLHLPTAYKLKRLKLRWFFKEALRGFLPDEILAKKKQGFGLPFGVWTTRHDALRAFVRDALESFAGRGVVRPAFTRELLDTHLPQHPGYYGDMVWVLVMLEQWLRQQPDHAWRA
jgi:asparagine synthase (glutamine-hydrolysing)